MLALFKEGIGLPLMLHGLPPSGSSEQTIHDWLAQPVAPDLVASISPLGRVQAGQYGRCPTYVIHGEADEVAPFVDAERFVRELAARDIPHGFLPVRNGVHIHDLALRPGMRDWEEQVAPGYRFLLDLVSRAEQ